MPTLPFFLPASPDSGDLPVRGADDVRAAFPAQARRNVETSHVREALIEAQAAMQQAWQDASSYAAAQSDPTRATGTYLDGHASDRDAFRQLGEGDESLRSRVFAVPAIVTPAAIVAAVDAILAGYTDGRCELFESVTDRLFLRDGGGDEDWHSFIGAEPSYPDRYYDFRTQASPGGAWFFSDSEVGRHFVLRVPEIDSIDGSHAYPLDGSTSQVLDLEGMWLADGTDTGGSESDGSVASFLSVGFGSALEVYQAIANTVEQLRGQAIRWQLFVDSRL